jgi:hypothetical protein
MWAEAKFLYSYRWAKSVPVVQLATTRDHGGQHRHEDDCSLTGAHESNGPPILGLPFSSDFLSQRLRLPPYSASRNYVRIGYNCMSS